MLMWSLHVVSVLNQMLQLSPTLQRHAGHGNGPLLIVWMQRECEHELLFVYYMNDGQPVQGEHHLSSIFSWDRLQPDTGVKTQFFFKMHIFI